MTEINIIKPQKFKAALEEKIVWSDNYTEFHFELKTPAKILNYAGQYIMIDIPNPDGSGLPLKRAYSMCDRPDVDHGFEILVATAGQGVGVRYLESLEFGEEIDCLGPLGTFHLEAANPEATAYTFVATGAGIASIKSMITELLQAKKVHDKPVKLYWGMRHEDDFMWLKDFETIDRDYDNFEFLPTVSQPGDFWNGSTGRVTDLLRAEKPIEGTDFFVCGSPAMVSEVTKILTDQYQMPLTAIHREQF